MTNKRYGETLKNIPEIIQAVTFKTAEDIETALNTIQDINDEILINTDEIYNGEGNDAFWLFRAAKALGLKFAEIYQASAETTLFQTS